MGRRNTDSQYFLQFDFCGTGARRRLHPKADWHQCAPAAAPLRLPSTPSTRTPLRVSGCSRRYAALGFRWTRRGLRVAEAAPGTGDDAVTLSSIGARVSRWTRLRRRRRGQRRRAARRRRRPLLRGASQLDRFFCDGPHCREPAPIWRREAVCVHPYRAGVQSEPNPPSPS